MNILLHVTLSDDLGGDSFIQFFDPSSFVRIPVEGELIGVGEKELIVKVDKVEHELKTPSSRLVLYASVDEISNGDLPEAMIESGFFQDGTPEASRYAEEHRK